ncbi:type II toxin-antitoxin system RelE/ParE family toxin [Rhizobium sp. CSW-27]|nr:type II toxin-antitoxin system RelE/ParE family toxin [Rhizobium sp. CSW-27]
MKRHSVRLMPEAEADLLDIFLSIRDLSSSEEVASGYLERILRFLSSFETFPERGSLRSEVRPGLRIIGFERRASIAFVVEENSVVLLRIAHGGRSLGFEDL